MSFVDACRSAFGGATVLSVGTTSLKRVGVKRRCASSKQRRAWRRSPVEYTVSTDGGLTYSNPVDVDGGASALETAIEQALGRMADPTDLTDTIVVTARQLTTRAAAMRTMWCIPVGGTFRLYKPIHRVSTRRRYLTVNTTKRIAVRGLERRVGQFCSGKFFLSYGDARNRGSSRGHLLHSVVRQDPGWSQAGHHGRDLIIITASRSRTPWSGGLEHPLRLGGLSSSSARHQRRR